MTRTFNGLGFALATALVLVGCTFTTDGSHAGGADGGPGSSDHPHDEPRDGGASSGELSFSPANVPADAPLGATGDWIFNTDTCGSTEVTIDTAKGTVSCERQAKGAFTFKTINQADTSQGTLTAGLFVTRRLVIEPSMVVSVIGNRPLVIVALTTATIQGTLRASAVAEHASGGGFDGGSTSDARGAGPGAGQEAAARAGAGGGGHCGNGGGGSAGGKAYGDARNTPLIGGSSAGSGLGRSGGGGGAVQVVAGAAIEVSGTGAITVSGGGGDWNSGGGGAGGAILLEAPVVSVFGALAANGGGGAAGEATNVGANGSASADPAKGGPGGLAGPGGSGGDGAAGLAIDGQSGTQPDLTRNQGGGGGAAGWIRLNTKSGSATVGATAVISPALSTRCATQGTPAAR